MRWTAAQRAAGADSAFVDNIITRCEQQPSFLVLGDPGQADGAQYCVVAPLLAEGGDTDFMVICSDVVYPAGNVNDYVNAFYVPYADYRGDVYALPGNHDWYDGLNGFMFTFCGSEPLPSAVFKRSSLALRDRLAWALWRPADAPKREVLFEYRNRMKGAVAPPADPWQPKQPGPYWALDAGPLRLVAIDTGVTGELDREQSDWFRRVSRSPHAKILLTGKPLYVDRERKPGELSAVSDDTFRYVDEVVRHDSHRYVAAIGGDVHNYQRYSIHSTAGRRIACVVTGGGGAYLSNTHRIPLGPAEYPEERLYPSRAQSMALYAGRFLRAGFASTLSVATSAIGTSLIAILSVRHVISASTGLWVAASALGLVTAVATALWLIRIGESLRDKPWTMLTGFPLASFCSGAAVAGGAAWLLQDADWSRILIGGAAILAVPLLFVLQWVVNRWFRSRRATISDDGAPAGMPPREPRRGPISPWREPTLVICFLGGTSAISFWWSRQPQAALAAGYVWITVLWIISSILVSDYLARIRPRVYRLYSAGVLVLATSGTAYLLNAIGEATALHIAFATLLGLGVVLWLTVTTIVLIASDFRPWRLLSSDLALRPGGNPAAYLDDAEHYFVSLESGDIPSRRTQRIAELVLPPRGWRKRSPVHTLVSEIFAPWEPPYYKNFARLDLRGDTLIMRAFGVEGKPTDEHSPLLIDELSIDLTALG